MKKLMIAAVLGSSLYACGGGAPPLAAPMAADNGQPRMQAALQALNNALTETTAAEANKGGHREKAIEQITAAIEATNAGIQYASAHANEAGADEGPAKDDWVDEEVKGANNQPHMANAVVALREARKQLQEAKHDKGGFRGKAIEHTKHAIEQLKEGIRFSDHH